MRLNHRVERLIHVVRDGIEGAGQPRYGVMRIQRIRVVCVTDAKRPGELASQFPGVLRIKIEIEEAVRLRISQRKSFRSRGRNPVDELRQGSERDKGNTPLAENIIVR